MIEADVNLTASSELSAARKASLSSISAQEDPERAEVVPTVDKSAPAIEPDTKLDNSFVKARRGSMKQIENRFRYANATVTPLLLRITPLPSIPTSLDLPAHAYWHSTLP